MAREFFNVGLCEKAKQTTLNTGNRVQELFEGNQLLYI